ncbi:MULTISPECIES: YraN family protein [Pseudanabaena]|jgi:putative endonuclease|uniref:YraN family protein n=1 Tax=Pseudanabaena TaxID=1152 RepID=UPI002479EDE2|nr:MULTISPECIES: YraN family protein [Pseudanabaena]MEA5488910.1 YraN family protein [Pseudanabaena sp. CCNP1317]WGS70767.1 YraN family protein [Pseudanabaena galeata CCNP1313]
MAKKVGDRGEILVAQLLQSHGWEILETQWRCRWGELDLIACDRQWLLFIEVKTRSDRNWDGDGSLAITPKKQAKLIRAASIFLGEHPQLATLCCRFDVALVRRTASEDFCLQSYIEQAFVA